MMVSQAWGEVSVFMAKTKQKHGGYLSLQSDSIPKICSIMSPVLSTYLVKLPTKGLECQH